MALAAVQFKTNSKLNKVLTDHVYDEDKLNPRMAQAVVSEPRIPPALAVGSAKKYIDFQAYFA